MDLIDKFTIGEGLASIVSDHKDTAFLELEALLEPLGITHFYPDDWRAYQRHLEPVFHPVGKVNTQTIKR